MEMASQESKRLVRAEDRAGWQAEPEAVAAIARRLEAEVQEAVARLVRHATDLAVAAAEALVGADARLARSAMEVALREAVTSMVGAVRLHVAVHPSQVDAARELVSSVQQYLQIVVEGDEHVRPGGCVVTSELGEVDATMESRVRRLQEAVREELCR